MVVAVPDLANLMRIQPFLNTYFLFDAS